MALSWRPGKFGTESLSGIGHAFNDTLMTTYQITFEEDKSDRYTDTADSASTTYTNVSVLSASFTDSTAHSAPTYTDVIPNYGTA